VVLLMLAAGCWGVLQLAVLSLGTRTVRSGTLLLAMAAGAYACGVTAVLAELAYTRLVHQLTGQPLQQVVETAGYTVDPVIEELVKLIPLVLVAVIVGRVRAQWGLTDFLLLGAAVGAGFGLFEALLRFSGRARQAFPDGDGGFFLPTSLYPPHIRSLVHTATSWLPPPIETLDILGGNTPDLNLHLVWTALAGLGIGLVVRLRGGRRWLGLLPLAYASLDHAANNYAITADPSGATGALLGGMAVLRSGLPALLLLALVATTVLDRLVLRRVRGSHPDLLLADERTGSRSVVALGRFARVALPATGLVALRFALTRRSVRYATAADRAGRRPALADDVGVLAAAIDAARDPARWRTARQEVSGTRPPVWRRWPGLVALVLAVPLVAYFVVGAVPQTAGLQQAMQSPPIVWTLAVLTLAAAVYAAVQVSRLARTVPEQLTLAWGEELLRSGLRLLVGVCAVTATVAVFGRLVLGGLRPDATVVVNYHALDAVAQAYLLVALLMLAVALMVVLFPPGGGLVAVGVGRLAAGALANPAVLAKAAVLLGALGAILMQASSYGGGSGRGGGSGGGGGTPRTNTAQNKQFRQAVQEGEKRIGRSLSKDERTRLHRAISGENLGYREIVEELVAMFGRGAR
jgi:protease prsW family protein